MWWKLKLQLTLMYYIHKTKMAEYSVTPYSVHSDNHIMGDKEE